ncbi:hypothetical protein L3Q82_008671, partial [Scortum barcoo]
LSGVGALNVNIPQDVYEVARGDNITLPCIFTTTSKSPSQIVITWSADVEGNPEEVQIVTYFYSVSPSINIDTQYEGRVSVDVDIAKGKADLKLSSITLADNTLFHCRVLIPGDKVGKPSDTARLLVLVAPSPPICKVQGKAEYGQNINLTCVSEEGSPTPTYKWDSRDTNNMPRLATDPRTTDKGGILSLYNISKDTSGYYICTSTNKIRSASCNLTLSVMPPSMNVASTAGIIVAVVAALIVFIIVIYCCCCKKKNKEEEYAMGVRAEEHTDKEPAARNGEKLRSDGQDRYEDRNEREDNRRSDYDDRRSDYDDRRSDYDDRRSEYSDRRDKYSDRHERYDDERHYDDRRDRRYDDNDRYDEPYDDRDRDRPPVPANKPPRRDYNN